MRICFLSVFSVLLIFCQRKPDDQIPVIPTPEPENPSVEQIDILALGDSYTIGQSVPSASNFPNQLADSLRADGRTVIKPKIIAQTGWRTDNLQAAINSQAAEIGDSTFSLVTLCIGVNNQYQNKDFDIYVPQFEQLLKVAIARAGGRKDRVVVVSIPDYAYTPFGQSSDPATISSEIDKYNTANQTISGNYGVHYVNVTGISRKGLSQPSLVAGDGLHPSGLQYTEWVKVMLPVVRTALAK